MAGSDANKPKAFGVARMVSCAVADRGSIRVVSVPSVESASTLRLRGLPNAGHSVKGETHHTDETDRTDLLRDVTSLRAREPAPRPTRRRPFDRGSTRKRSAEIRGKIRADPRWGSLLVRDLQPRLRTTGAAPPGAHPGARGTPPRCRRCVHARQPTSAGRRAPAPRPPGSWEG